MTAPRTTKKRAKPVDEPPANADTRPIWEKLIELGQQIPPEEWAKVPSDLSINLDHYLYGAPKNEP